MQHRPEWSVARARYTTVAIALHWIMAALILLQIGFGLQLHSMLENATDAESRRAVFEFIQIHKALGLTVLALAVLRLVWRLWRPAPPLPEEIPAWQQGASAASHIALYALMIGVPLSGWAMSTVSLEYGDLPTTWFGLFEIPHLPGLASLSIETRAELDAAFRSSHTLLSYATILLLFAHVGAALKHHVIDGDAVLARMTPGLQPRGFVLEAPLGWAGGLRRAAGFALLAAAGLGVAWLYLGERVVAMVAEAREPAVEVAAEDGSDEALDAAADAAEGAPVWTVDHDESRIAFDAAAYGAAFEGSFPDWRAEIAFDPDAPESAQIRVEVDLATVATGESQYDGALQSSGWFDVAAHPTAVFEAEGARRGDGGGYVADGSLTLRGVTLPLSLPFDLSIDGDRADMAAEVVVSRLDFGVGAVPDATGGTAPLEIPVRVRVVATRAPAAGE